MTFEERLDRLGERTQAIAESLELVVLQVRELGNREQAANERTDRLERLIEKDGEHIRALARIAEIHERRLTNLEGAEPA